MIFGKKWFLIFYKIPESYGEVNVGLGQKVNVEYVSTNPTGPIHIGHARGAIFGDSLALLLQKAGYLVTKEFYINDAGVQIEKLARSTYLRYIEALGETVCNKEDFAEWTLSGRIFNFR